MTIVKVADDYKADSAEFVNFGRFATEVCVSKNIKLRLRDKPTSIPLLILSVAPDFISFWDAFPCSTFKRSAKTDKSGRDYRKSALSDRPFLSAKNVVIYFRIKFGADCWFHQRWPGRLSERVVPQLNPCAMRYFKSIICSLEKMNKFWWWLIEMILRWDVFRVHIWYLVIFNSHTKNNLVCCHY